MVSKQKKQNDLNNNILYLQEADAKALGIMEGFSQRVFVDDREVEVVFVDEHEVVPVSNEDKKIYQEAYKIAEKYLEASANEKSHAWNTLAAGNANARDYRNIDDPYNYSNNKKFSFKEGWNSFKNLFKRSSNRSNDYYNQEVGFEYQNDLEPRFTDSRQRSMVKYQSNNQPMMRNNVAQRHAQHSIRNDVFTKEELEIIQNVIDKTRELDNDTSIRMAKYDNAHVSNSNNSIKKTKVKSNNSKSKVKK